MRRNIRTRNRNKNKKFKQNIYENEKSLIKHLSFSVIALIILLIIVAVSFYFYNTSKHNSFINSLSSETSVEPENSEENEKEEAEDTTFSLCAIGDIMCHNTQYQDAYNSDSDSYDFSYVFDDISLYTKTADLCIGNLETTFAGKDRGYSSYPTFNTPDELATNLKKLGLDVLTTANNHCLDKGIDGLNRTIDILNDADISHLGTYKSQEERDTVFIKYVKGLKIAFINYTYGTNGITVPSDKPYCVNLIDNDLILKDINSAKEQNADIIVACMHWGTEYNTTPSNSQKETADFLFKNGVNIVLGGHPHVLQPMEKRTVTLDDGTTKDGFIIYSLGNFMADQTAKNTKDSIILDLTITKHVDGTVTIDKAEYIPIYLYKDSTSKEKKFKILDIEKSILNYESGMSTNIDETLYNTLKKELENIKNIVGEEIK